MGHISKKVSNRLMLHLPLTITMRDYHTLLLHKLSSYFGRLETIPLLGTFLLVSPALLSCRPTPSGPPARQAALFLLPTAPMLPRSELRSSNPGTTVWVLPTAAGDRPWHDGDAILGLCLSIAGDPTSDRPWLCYPLP